MSEISTLIGMGASLGRDVERLRARVESAGFDIKESMPTMFVLGTNIPQKKIHISISFGIPRESLCEVAWVNTGQAKPELIKLVSNFEELLRLLRGEK